MFRSAFFAVLMAGLPVIRPVQADDKPATSPHIVVQIQPVDKWLTDGLIACKSLAPVLAAFDLKDAKPEELLALVLSRGWREAIESSKPWGLYLVLHDEIAASEPVFLVPVKTPEAFIKLLDSFHVSAQEENGAFTLEGAFLPQPLCLRFAHGYAYAALSAEPVALPRLVKPGEMFLAKQKVQLEMRTLLDHPSAKWKESLAALVDSFAIGGLPGQKQLFEAIAELMREALAGSRDLNARLQIDPKTGVTILDAEWNPVPDSPWAKRIAKLQPLHSRFGKAFDEGAAASYSQTYEFPGALYYSPKLAGSIINDLKPELEEIKIDPEKLDAVIRTVLPSLHTDVYDTAIALFQENDKCCAVYGIGIKDGVKSEKILLEYAKELPEKAREYVSLSAAKAGSVNLHRIKLPAKALEDIRSEVPFFGDSELWFAIQDDALILAFGDRAKERLEKSLTRSVLEPAPLFRLDVDIYKIMPLAEHYPDRADTVYRTLKTYQEFAGNDGRRVGLSLTRQEANSLKIHFETNVLSIVRLIAAYF
ncbi:MAG TPA: hypothetical protein VKS79_14785, partial [Gemmataceae bacterium]|nr:hypothetical protein [Gemmataceae bacterium]